MKVCAIQKMLQEEGIRTVLEEEALREMVFPDDNYHEIEKGADGWKFNYVSRGSITRINYECIKKEMSEEEAAVLFLVCELEKHFNKQFFGYFYQKDIRLILEEETNEYGLKKAMDQLAIPFRYVSLMGYEPYMTRSILLYLPDEMWAVSYINRLGRKITYKKEYGEYLDAMIGVLECSYKLFLYDLFVERKSAKGIEIRALTDEEVAVLLGVYNQVKTN